MAKRQLQRSSAGDGYTGYEVFHILQSPVLTRERVRFAYVVAVTTDVLQLLLGPFGWAFADELLDVMEFVGYWVI